MTLVESIYNNASASLETRRIPDPFPIQFNNQGKLILTYTGEVIEESIEKQTYLGQAEFVGFQRLQSWLRENPEGEIAWLSPPFPEVYEVPKIIVYNRNLGVATVLDGLSAEDCLYYAQDLGLVTDSFEKIRTTPIPLNGKDWLSLLEKYTNVSKERQMISSGYYLLEKQRALKDPLLGNMPLRCDLRQSTGFQTMFENTLSHDKYGSRQFECPHCHKTNTRPTNQCIKFCQHCNKDVSC